MEYVEAVELPITILIAILGWHLSARMITHQRKKELRLNHLIEAYFMFREFEHDGISSSQDFVRFQRAINSFYLLGDSEQIAEMEKFKEAHMGVGGHELNFDDINVVIVRQIRKELGLPFYKGKYGIAMMYTPSAPRT